MASQQHGGSELGRFLRARRTPGLRGQRLGVFTAEPGTPDYEAIVVLDGMAGQDAGHPVVDATS
ncbi:hypothetical protein [Streptomyces anulatus]|uniref:hypothetical protein n=1 Tax=Streptomyces anulatus TaxID=1892 RepID=UPI000A42C7F5|nr:hypothetical protein [Streptomyces anulatus]WSR74363.1 hypothetical protein OG274_03675 [Streptomyces anulatus]WUD93062.1 hypothetical protein OG703_34950 [Streptomyces anulatus]GGY48194.1 hypothetical protein GCM10010342_39460 [Streptomyces anulatus]